MRIQAETIASYCTETVLRLGDDNVAFVIPVRALVLGDNDVPFEKNDLTRLAHLGKTGFYAFVDEKGQYCYIGQGGAGSSTSLKGRLGQELRLYKKTENGNNGGTLSKNIQELCGLSFIQDAEFKKYISGWSLRIIHSARFEVAIELIEAFAIELLRPSLNKIGRGV